MRKFVLLAVFGMTGCGLDPTAYISKRAEIECDYAMRCYPPSVLEFYGWGDAEECVAERGPELTGDAEGCTFDAKKAKACLKQFEDAACPADGEDPVFPVVCDEIYDCGTVDTDGGGDTDTDVRG
jgi:hypothetical protein